MEQTIIDFLPVVKAMWHVEHSFIPHYNHRIFVFKDIDYFEVVIEVIFTYFV